MKPTNSIPSSVFQGYPITLFRVQERRSLTVHLEDAGMFDVLADPSINDAPDAPPAFAGRYESFGEASTVCEGLNRIWYNAPQVTGAEIIGFVNPTL